MLVAPLVAPFCDVDAVVVAVDERSDDEVPPLCVVDEVAEAPDELDLELVDVGVGVGAVTVEMLPLLSVTMRVSDPSAIPSFGEADGAVSVWYTTLVEVTTAMPA